MPLLIDFIRIRRPTFCTTAHACSKSPLFLFTSGESTGFFFPASADLLAFVTRLASILRIGRLCNNIRINEVYTDPTVGSVVWALRNRKSNCACVVIVCEVTARALSKSDNVFCVGSSFPHFRRAFTSFEDNTHSQFYTRDVRTLTAAARLTPKFAEKANTDLTTSSDTRVGPIHVGSTDIGRRRRQGLGRGSASVRHRVRQGRPIVIVLKRTAEHGFSKSHHPAPEEEPSSSQPYPLRGAEHKHWAETLHYALLSQMCDRF